MKNTFLPPAELIILHLVIAVTTIFYLEVDLLAQFTVSQKAAIFRTDIQPFWIKFLARIAGGLSYTSDFHSEDLNTTTFLFLTKDAAEHFRWVLKI